MFILVIQSSSSGRNTAMYKSLFMVLVAFLLSAGAGLAEEMTEDVAVDEVVDEVAEVVTVAFTGVAETLTEADMPGAPTVWAVNVTAAEDEFVLCSQVVNVTVFQATPGPWGFVDENVTEGSVVEVFGAYVEDETGCMVTLEGSEEYYFVLAAEEEAEEEVVETEVVDEEVVEEEAEEEAE
jgi:hypothetical protein